MQEHRWQHPGAMLPNARDALRKDTFEVGIALLTAMPILHYVVACAHGLDSKFAKLFQRNLQKSPFAKKLDPRKFSAIQYYFGFTYIGKQLNLSRLQVTSG